MHLLHSNEFLLLVTYMSALESLVYS